MSGIKKFLKYPALAKLGAIHANQKVQLKRGLIKGYQEAKKIDPAVVTQKSKYQDLVEGAKGLHRELKNRQRAAKALAQSVAKPDAGINRMVNAHGKGIVFRRVGGRIVPMRKK